jgi:NAD(P)-dependent dehydrogenase (short-subunit alcohol dehydrogenase family)
MGLLDRLRAASGGPARIVNTSSDAHRGASLDFDDLQCERKYGAFPVYKKSKLANILFTRELARRLAGSNMTANSLHPGFVSTRFGHQTGGWMAWFIKALQFTAISPEEGAKTIVYLASSDEVAGKSGDYYYKCKVSTPTKEAQDDESARRLWGVTEKLTA